MKGYLLMTNGLVRLIVGWKRVNWQRQWCSLVTNKLSAFDAESF
jgi:hypothetical protein